MREVRLWGARVCKAGLAGQEMERGRRLPGVEGLVVERKETAQAREVVAAFAIAVVQVPAGAARRGRAASLTCSSGKEPGNLEPGQWSI